MLLCILSLPVNLPIPVLGAGVNMVILRRALECKRILRSSISGSGLYIPIAEGRQQIAQSCVVMKHPEQV